MTNASPPLIAVCCCTFKRPAGIKKLLEHLEPAVELLQGHATVKTIVIDNDANGSARETVEHFAKLAQHPIEYQIEPNPGIPAARNASVSWAMDQHADFLAFIDDDEYPSKEWLQLHLTYLQENPDVSVVNGPVTPHFPQDTPKWMKKSSVFKRKKRATGTCMESCATNNTLTRKTVFEQIPEWFDDAFKLTGGSDSDFFGRAAEKGIVIHYFSRPFVTEDVPQSRLTWSWIISRLIRLAACNASRRVKLKQTTRLACLCVGSARMGTGTLMLLCIIGWLPYYRSRSLALVFRGYGKIIGAFHHNIDTYKVED